jgi:N-acetylmuramoyl-L-alanine amidase
VPVSLMKRLPPIIVVRRVSIGSPLRSGLYQDMRLVERPSPNHDTRSGVVDMLILHYTGMPTGVAALERLCDPEAKVSAHYMIDEDGTVYRLVAEERRAWHAGVSFWAGEASVNGRSIGIELVNPGHEWGYRSFPAAQIDALIELGRGVLSRHAIPPSHVVGHSDVAPDRKIDPGELFPWNVLAKNDIGVWPEPAAPAGDFATMLAAFGYGVPPDVDIPLTCVIAAFQRHFRPARIDGVADAECRAILAGLVAG